MLFNNLKQEILQTQFYKLTYCSNNLNFSKIETSKMKQIACAFHPNEYIVNFCKSRDCLLPLCPICIRIHLKQHQQESTYGEFETIQGTFQNVSKTLTLALKTLLDSGDHLKQVLENKQEKRLVIQKKMQDLKNKIMVNIERYIEDLEKQILKKLWGAQVNLQEQFSNIETQIQNVVSKINKEISVISGDKVLKGLISHFGEQKQVQYQSELQEIQTKINSIEATDIAICKEFKNSQLNTVNEEIRKCYQSVFIGTINPKGLKRKQSRYNTLRESQQSEY